MNIEELKNILNNEYDKTKGTYRKAVISYALELVDNIGDCYETTQEQRNNLEKIDRQELKALALNGADNWSHYSWNGCSLCYNYDILKNLFCPSIVKKYENANCVKGIHLLDLQANAISKSFNHILCILKRDVR